jgi:hypothetical protein
MSTKNAFTPRRPGEPGADLDARAGEAAPLPRNRHWPIVAADAVAGMMVGGLAGVLAGPAGAAVGAVLGGVVGAAAGATAMDCAEEDRDRDSQLDVDIGVTGGDIGAPWHNQPPPRMGASPDAPTGGSARSGVAAGGPGQIIE